MKTTALRYAISAGAAIALTATSFAQTTATTPPVGYYKLAIQGASDNIMSLPMVRDAVFSGTVGASVSDFGFDVLSGTASPNWSVAPKQFVYAAGAQPLTYYVEFTTGQLKGLYYKIIDNGTGSLEVDAEGDILTDHPVNGSAAALAPGDGITIRPYWRIRDALESGGSPIIEARPNEVTVKDDVLIPNYTGVGINKAASLIFYYLAGTGWQLVGDEGTDYGDYILRPNEGFIIRRRNAASINLTNLGSVLTNRAITFVAGGQQGSPNDTYVSINRPAPVSLNASGLWNSNQAVSLIQESPNDVNITDRVLMFSGTAGFNKAPAAIFFFLAGQPDGEGWRVVGDEENTTIGNTVFLEPGKVFIVRKLAANSGVDWVNDPNY